MRANPADSGQLGSVAVMSSHDICTAQSQTRAPVSLHSIASPFALPSAAERIPETEQRRGVLVFTVRDTPEWTALSGRLPAFRRTLPSMPFAIRTPAGRAGMSARVGALALLAGVRAVVSEATTPVDLRDQLTDAELLPRQQLVWPQAMRIIPKGVCSETALALLEEGPKHETFQETAKRIGRNPDRLQDLFRDVGAATSPGRVCCLARWTRIGLLLQRSQEPIEDVARAKLGHKNPRSMRAAFRRMFAGTPVEVRSWTGFESLFASHCTRLVGHTCAQ